LNVAKTSEIFVMEPLKPKGKSEIVS